MASFKEKSSVSGDGYFVAMYHQHETPSNPLNVWPQPYAVQETESAFVPSKTRRLEFAATYQAAGAIMSDWVSECRETARKARLAALKANGIAYCAGTF